MKFVKSCLTGLAVLSSMSLASAAAPMLPALQEPATPQRAIERVHFNHANCQLGFGTWHRHAPNGARRSCRRWNGVGRRPDFCVKIGPIFYCDY